MSQEETQENQVHVEIVSIDELEIDEKGSNPRIHTDENQDLITKSIEEIKPWRSVAIDENNKSVAGTGTITGAKRAGVKQVVIVEPPDGALVAVRRRDLSDDDKKRYAVLDNLSSDTSHFDKQVIEMLREEGITEGFDDILIAQMAKEGTGAPSGGGDGDESEAGEDKGARIDEAGALLIKWGVRPGQIWEIPSHTARGECHYIMCGCSDVESHVEALMQGERATLFATDPPYFVDYDGKNHPQHWKKKPKKSEQDEDVDFDPEALESETEESAFNGETEEELEGEDGIEVAPVAAYQGENGEILVSEEEWHKLHYGEWDTMTVEEGSELYRNFMKAAIKHALKENAAWYCWHASKYEKILEDIWTEMKAFKHCQIIWVKDRPVFTRSWYMWQHEPCLMGWIRGNKPQRATKDYLRTVWFIDTIPAGKSGLHPTQKPVQIFENPMRQHCRAGDIAYEPFSGSGSQLVAGENCRVRVHAMERNPRYVAIALERMEEMGLFPTLVQEIEVDLDLWKTKEEKANQILKDSLSEE